MLVRLFGHRNIHLTKTLLGPLCLAALMSASPKASDAPPNGNLCVNIATTDLKTPLLQEVEAQVREVCGWLEQFKKDENSSHYLNALGSIKSHAFLYTYAEALSELPEASLGHLIKKAEELWPDLDTMKAPPSTHELKVGSDEDKFNKLNRFLFRDFDAKVYQLIGQEKEKYSCAAPVVEWAENVIGGDFNLKAIKGHSHNLTLEAVIKALKSHYTPQKMREFLAGSWPLVYKNITSHKRNSHQSNLIFDQLRSDQCYPARKSLDVATKLIEHEKAGIDFVEAFDKTKELMGYLQGFCFNRCKQLKNDLKDQNNFTDYKCAGHEQNYCHNFWHDFAKGYKDHLSHTYDTAPLDKKWHEEAVKAEISSKLEIAGFEKDEPCP